MACLAEGLAGKSYFSSHLLIRQKAKPVKDSFSHVCELCVLVIMCLLFALPASYEQIDESKMALNHLYPKSSIAAVIATSHPKLSTELIGS